MEDKSGKRFVLWRLDDNGNSFQVALFDQLAEAESRMAELSRNPHKQIYWIEDDSGGSGE